MGNGYITKERKNGKKKVYTAERYRFITVVKTAAVTAAAIIVAILFCGAVFDKHDTVNVLNVISIVSAAVVVIAFGTYLLSEKPSDPEKRKGKGKRK